MRNAPGHRACVGMKSAVLDYGFHLTHPEP